MYSIEVTDPERIIVFNDMNPDVRFQVSDPALELEDNAAGSLEFTIYNQNPAYGSTPETVSSDDPLNYLTSMATTIRVYKEVRSIADGTWSKKEIWEGRPLSEDTDFYNGRKIYCEGAYAYLNDVDQPYKEYVERDATTGEPTGALLEIETFIKGVLTEYNNKASTSPNRRFNVEGTYVNPLNILPVYNYKGELESTAALPGTAEVYDLYKITSTETWQLYTYAGWIDATTSVHRTLGLCKRTGGETTKAAIDSVVEAVGGHVKVVTDANGGRCLFYTAMSVPEPAFVAGDPSVTTFETQRITFGKNLLDLTKKKDFSDFYTVLLPVGAQIDPSVPETVESMCVDVLNDTSCWSMTTTGEELQISTNTPVFDATHVTAEYNTGNSGTARRLVYADLDAYAGYDVFLYTSNYYRTDPQGEANIGTYLVLDRSPQISKIASMAALGYGALDMDGRVIGGLEDGTLDYNNNRIVAFKQLTKTQYSRQTVDGERISIADVGATTLSFAVASDYCWYSVKGNPSSNGRIDEVSPNMDVNSSAWRSTYRLEYPKLYRMPYKRFDYSYSGVRKVPDSDIRWVGAKIHPSDPNESVSGKRDLHWLRNISTEPYISYGAEDCDMIPVGEYGIFADDGTLRLTISGDKSAHVLDRFPPFGTDANPTIPYPGVSIPSFWSNGQGGYDTNKRFLTGYFGRHVARVMVEPGKTYYLNTRVTNPGFPDISGYDRSWNYASEVDPSKWIFDEQGTPKKRIYHDIFAYAVIARRQIRSRKNQPPLWSYEVLSYKLADKSNVTTELSMEKIEVPNALYVEKKVSFDDANFDSIEHLEIWFSCDNCYINGNSNLGDPQVFIEDFSNPSNGYRPSIYVEDKDLVSSDATSGTDWHECVTIAPINDNSQIAGYTNFPNEYYINKDLADKYGVIVRRIDYPEATTPEKLRTYAINATAMMEEAPSFEISAVDLKDCGIEDCESLALHQTIFIDSEPHGLDPEKETGAVLSQMSINLSDLSSNTYTLGYQPYKGLSQQNGG